MKRSELEKMDLMELNKELKRIASLKCNLKKRKIGEEEKQKKLVEILKEEDLVKEVKNSKLNKGKGYYEFEKDDIDKLDKEGLIRFRKGIASKKCIDGSDEEVYKRCEALLEYSKVKLEEKRDREERNLIRKDEIRKVIENAEINKSLELLIEALKNLIK